MTRFSIFVFGMLVPALTYAQGSTGNKATAEALFAEGRRLMDEKQYEAACKKFESSQKLDPGAGTLLNLAACYEQSGQTASAWVTYKEAAAASQARHPDWAQQALARVGELEPKLSKLTIQVDKPVSGIVVTRDGITIESTAYGVAIPVDPGTHAVEARAPGYGTFHVDVTISGERDAKSVTVPELAPGETTKASSSSGSAQRIIGISMMGAGGVGLVLGTVFGVVSLGKKSDASAFCSRDFSVCNDMRGISLVSDAKSMGTISTISFIAGGVLVAGGFVLFLVAPKGEKAPVEARLGAEGAQFGATIGGTF